MTRNSRRLWHTAAFRLAIAFALIFGLGAAAMLMLVDFGIGRSAKDEMRSALDHQMAIMRADAELEGGPALASILAEHVRTDTINHYRYAVVDRDGREIFNSGIPKGKIDDTGFSVVMIGAGGSPASSRQALVPLLVLAERSSDGTLMIVGRETYPLHELRQDVRWIALGGSLGLVILAAISGASASLLFLRRLERVNQTTRRIMSGNLDQRIPPIGFGSEFHDLTTNLNAMLERLEAAMTAMRQVSTDLAHDLRMPLTRLRHRLEEIARTSATPQIEGAIEEADELLALFNSMLRLARLESGSIRHDMVRIDLGDLVEKMVGAYQPEAEESGRRLLLDTPAGAFIVGDLPMLNQLLANLIDNGLSYTPEGSTIQVRVGVQQDGVTLAVCDDGYGVPDDQIPLLTKRFYRADGSRGRPGAGLGLAVASAVIDLHGGTITIADNNPGLCVTIRFPAAD